MLLSTSVNSECLLSVLNAERAVEFPSTDPHTPLRGLLRLAALLVASLQIWRAQMASVVRKIIVLAAAERAVAAGCQYNAVQNYDLNGGDLPNQPVSKTLSTVDECAQLCCQAGWPCVAFALNAGAAGSRWCYLKSGGWQNISSPGCESGELSNPPPAPVFPWFNLSLARSDRLEALLDAMTVEEQISWLVDGAPAIPRLGIPAYSWEAEASHGVAWNGVATVFPAPIAWGASFDTALASSIATVIAIEARAKWVSSLGPDGSSAEFAGLSFMTPNNNLFLDGRWGRGQETNGEDPVLTSAITSAVVHALQEGPTPAYNRIIAVSKHFLGYHLESWAGNGQYRLSHSYNYSDTDLAQYYMKPFVAAVRANVSSIMCAYDGQNGTNPAWPYPGGKEPWGVPMCLSPLLQTYLRDELGFQGYIISDEGAVTFAGPGYHAYTPTVKDAACLALNAGTDLCLGGEYADTLGPCLQDGNVTAARIRQALSRTLSAQFQLGWFDTLGARRQGLPDPVAVYNNVTVQGNVSTPEHRQLSLAAARAGMVLLKNSGGVLPLSSSLLASGRVALVGPTADHQANATGSYLGNYAGCEDGPGGSITQDIRCTVVTLLDAMQAASASYGFTLSYAQGCDVNTPGDSSGYPAAIAAAKGADVIVAAMGLDTCQETACSEGEANDRLDTLDLRGAQLGLLQALTAAYPNTPLVLVLLNGGPVSSPWAFNASAAILEAWYPGYEGGYAIVDILTGAYSPAGRLPITLVSDISQLPLYTDTVLSTPPGRTHMYYSGVPLYPFGYGLSYTTFSYSGMTVTPSILAPATLTVNVSTVVTNTGAVASDEVVQLYGSLQLPSTGLSSIPKQQLLAFTRLHALAPGESRAVAFILTREDLQLIGPDGGMAVLPGTWRLTIGGGPPNNAQYPGGTPVKTGVLIVQ